MNLFGRNRGRAELAPPARRRDYSRYDQRLDALLKTEHAQGRDVGRGIFDLLRVEVEELEPRHHFLHGSLRAKEAVILTGSFKPGNQHSRPQDIQRGRKLTIDAAHNRVRYVLETRGNRPVWALSWAAAYVALTGEKCWSDDEESRIKEDTEDIIQRNATPGSFNSASNAADYRLAFNEEIWTPEQRDFMVVSTLEDLRYYTESQLTHVKPFGSPGTVPLTSRAADLRVLQAVEIRPIMGDPARGIEIIDPPFMQ